MDQECPRSEPSLSSGNCVCLLYFLFQRRCNYRLVEATCQEKNSLHWWKKTKPPLHDSSCTHCNIMPLTRLLSPSLANSRCLVKSVRRVTRLSWLHVWTPSCGSWPQLVTAQAGAETCPSEGSQWQAVYLQSQAWGDRGEGKEGHANTEKKGCPLGRLEVAWGVI